MPYERKKFLAYARANRLAPTGAESELYRLIRTVEMGRVRRQYSIGRIIVDLAIPGRNLIVEVDGESHSDKQDQDLRRDAWLRGLGFNVIRLSNEQILEMGVSSLTKILEFEDTTENSSRFHNSVRTAQKQSRMMPDDVEVRHTE